MSRLDQIADKAKAGKPLSDDDVKYVLAQAVDWRAKYRALFIELAKGKR
jgi:hypothetical protein